MSQQVNEFAWVSHTDGFVFLHLIAASIGIIVGLVFMIFVPITQVHLITALSILCTCLAMPGILKLMKYGMSYIHKRYNTGEMQQCRNQMIIGFGGITMCGITILYYCFITFYITSVIFFYHFIYEFQKKWKIDYEKKHGPLISILLAVQIILLIITLVIIIGFSDEVTSAIQAARPLSRISFEVCTSMYFASSMIDMGVVLAGGIKKNLNLEMESVEVLIQPSTPENPIIEANSPRIDCKICMEEYGETVIPRILKECGHTICEKCAGQLLEKNNGQYLFCPFCQAVTIVKGPASQLPKNFAIINMIDEKM